MLRLLLGIVAAQTAQQVGRKARRMGHLVFAAVLALVGFGFVLSAIWTALAYELGPIWASGLIGGVFLFLALIVLLISGQKPRPDAALAAELAVLEAQLRKVQADAAGLGAEVSDSIGRKPAVPLMAAFAGGLLLALKLRR